MSTAVMDAPVSLRRPVLSRAQVGLLGAAYIGLTAVLFALTPFQGTVDFVLVAYGVQRFVRVEQALTAGEFAPLRPKDALFLAVFAGVLGVATLAFIFVH